MRRSTSHLCVASFSFTCFWANTGGWNSICRARSNILYRRQETMLALSMLSAVLPVGADRQRCICGILRPASLSIVRLPDETKRMRVNLSTLLCTRQWSAFRCSAARTDVIDPEFLEAMNEVSGPLVCIAVKMLGCGLQCASRKACVQLRCWGGLFRLCWPVMRGKRGTYTPR